MLEYFFATLQNFKTHKLRSILSLLGIIIGIMTVVIITTLGSSMYGTLVKIMKDESRTPSNLLRVMPQWNPKTRRIDIVLDEAYRKALLAQTKKIQNFFYVNQIEATVLRGSAELNKQYRMQSLTGVENGYLYEPQVTLEQGDFFSLSDFAERRQKAIISASLAQKLFPEGQPVGKKFSVTIPLRSRRGGQNNTPLIFYFEVSGVIASSATDNQIKIYVPRTFITTLKHIKTADDAFLIMRDENDFTELKTIVAEFSDKYSGAKDSVYIYSSKQMMLQLNQMLTTIQIVLSCVAFISLFVGGINIMNIMIATVAERKKEIGIRKALGATNADITVQFLVEAVTLTLSGSILGVCFGLLISATAINLIPLKAIINMPIASSKMDFILNIQGIVIAFGVSVAVGVFFGLRPAIKAAKLDPIVALS